ncbi:GntR family transcriptional regulator [Actinoallomurus purpureus]|uniref:GntR family transcriptional regulator n=1 Tax=Actinoallomurus purpureus TaxID=478114 RepID=UPI0020926484|nr:GntR family transcriptional regulator [Actinoallomurus purpureus]MCO6009898.1 GntR family transcriptional regulator [Actinoallomurus purpureus]
MTSATSRAYDHVKQAILDRAYPGGALLSEGEIATTVGVSRTPVREALLRLEAEGLVRLYPKRGALVLPVSPQEIADVFEARELVETFAAGKATPGPELVAELTGFLEAMREHSAAGNAREFARADRCFHRAIVAAAGNEIITQLYDALRDRQLRMARLTADDPDRTATAIHDHSEILEAVRSGDRRRIRGAIHRHRPSSTGPASLTG